MQHIANDREHSLEIQLPFLQVALSQPFTLLPVMVRSQDPALLEAVARAIAPVLRTAKPSLWPARTYHTFIQKTKPSYWIPA